MSEERIAELKTKIAHDGEGQFGPSTVDVNELCGLLTSALAAAEAGLAEKQQEIDTLTEEVDCHSAEEDGWEHDLRQERALREAAEQRADGLEAEVAELVKGLTDAEVKGGTINDVLASYRRVRRLVLTHPDYDSARRVAAAWPAKLVYMATDTDDKTLSTLKLHFDARVTDELRALVLTALNDAALTREGDGNAN